MSKQMKPLVVEVPVTDPERQEELIMERCTFALLVMIVAGGNVEDFLKTCDQETRNEYGRIWDAQKAVPVGILFNRPNWEGTKWKRPWLQRNEGMKNLTEQSGA